MRTFASNHVQTDKLGHLWSHSGLCVLVIGKFSNNPLARGRVLSVVNQLRRGVPIGDGLECSDLLVVMVVEVPEPGWLRKKVGFVLMQLDVRHEPVITDVFGECLLKRFNSLRGQVAQFFGVCQPRKLCVDGVEVNHRRKEYIPTALLCEKSSDVILHRRVLTAPTSMNSSFSLGMGDEDRRMQIDSPMGEVRLEHCIGERKF